MTHPSLRVGAVLTLLLCAACERGARNRAIASAGNAMTGVAAQTAVGPVPGPAVDSTQPQNPYKNQPEAMVDGRQLFVQFNCSGCHGGRAGGGMAPSLRDVDWLYGATDAQIFSSIAEGRAHGMPAWGSKLTDDQVWKLVAYVHSLRTPDEPHPPS